MATEEIIQSGAIKTIKLSGNDIIRLLKGECVVEKIPGDAFNIEIINLLPLTGDISGIENIQIKYSYFI